MELKFEIKHSHIDDTIAKIIILAFHEKTPLALEWAKSTFERFSTESALAVIAAVMKCLFESKEEVLKNIALERCHNLLLGKTEIASRPLSLLSRLPTDFVCQVFATFVESDINTILKEMDPRTKEVLKSRSPELREKIDAIEHQSLPDVRLA